MNKLNGKQDTYPNSSLKEKIQALEGNANSCKLKWNRHACQPYADAYDLARTRFYNTIEQDKQDRENKVDLALTALSLAGGSIFTAVFTRATRKTLADAALNFICNNNLN